MLHLLLALLLASNPTLSITKTSPSVTQEVQQLPAQDELERLKELANEGELEVVRQRLAEIAATFSERTGPEHQDRQPRSGEAEHRVRPQPRGRQSGEPRAQRRGADFGVDVGVLRVDRYPDSETSVVESGRNLEQDG